jgi:succinate-semialdehyde dehydrogenase/glutarate-semialdehyde dehydrogenase
MEHYLSLCLINGEWARASDGATFTVCNPATKQTLAEVPSLPRSDIERAISGASQAFSLWSTTPSRSRAELLYSLERLLRENSEQLASVITAESGKPLREARGEVNYSANYIRWFAEESMRIYGDIVPADSAQKRIFVVKQAVGVVAAITPWNFPLAMLARKAGAALAAGCTCIAKPAPETPLSAIFFASLCKEAGFPAGTISIVTGEDQVIGPALMESTHIRKVSFTGSTEVGKLLIRQSADTVKKLTLELGGNAPFIVFEDADLDIALDGAIFGKYRNAGQTCICVNRFLVHEKLAPLFTQKLVERSRALVVGDGAHEKTDIGPLISRAAVEKVQGLVDGALAEGAHCALPSAPLQTGPLFLSPIILTNVTPTMKISREEIFGPVSAISTFSSEDEAVRLANDTPYGLAAYVYSRDLRRALLCAERLDFGMVGINDTAISNVQAPFGGVKQSGFGREGSRYGIEEYLVTKYISVGM